MSKFNECTDKLIEISENKGYLVFDDIMDISDTFELSVSEVDRLSEALQLRGIIIYENEPEKKEVKEELEDYSRVDYDAIYNEIIEMDNNLKDYIDTIKNQPTPQYGEIQTLAFQVQNGNEYARNRLIIIHMRNVLKIALSMTKQYDYEINDAISAGMMGLCISVDRYDPNGFSAFQSYASMWIQQNIQRECKPKWIDFYYPAHYLSGLLQVEQMYNNHCCEKCREHRCCEELIQAVTNKLDCNKEQAEGYIQHIEQQKSKLSVEELWDDNQDEIEQFNTLDDLTFKEIEKEWLKEDCLSVLATLKEREREVLRMRFGFSTGESMTLEEVGQLMGVTRERIRQIESKALRKLGHGNAKKLLEDYLS